MPDDETLDELSDDRLERYDHTIQALKQATQDTYPLELILALLASFGIGEGHGVFGQAMSLIEAYPHAYELYPLIQEPENGVVGYWEDGVISQMFLFCSLVCTMRKPK